MAENQSTDLPEQPSTMPQPAQVADLSAKHIIVLVQDVVTYLKLRWKTIGWGTLTFTLLAILYWANSVPKYTAYASFTTDTGSNASPALSMAGAFGLPISSGEYSNELLVGLTQSRRVIKKVFLTPAIVKNKHDLLANHYIEYFGYRRDWEDIPWLADFKFVNDDLTQLTHLEDSVLSLFYIEVVEKRLLSEYAPEMGMIIVEFTTKIENFSKAFCKGILHESTEYFIEKEISQARKTYKASLARKDSLYKALKTAEFKLAQWQDSKKRIYKAEGHLNELELTRNVAIVNAMYSASASSFEMAKFELTKRVPAIIIVDDPDFSTSRDELDFLTALIAGVILGAFFTASMLTVWKFIKDALEEE